MSAAQLIFCTVPDRDKARYVANHLVEQGLAACCNIIPGLESVYTWQGSVQTEPELLLLIKSTEEKYISIEHAIKKLHPYDVPEIIAVDVTHGSDAYLQWIAGAVNDTRGRATQQNSE